MRRIRANLLVPKAWFGGPKGPDSRADDVVVQQLTQRLTSLHDNCLTGLVAGLDAMREGDLTVEVAPVTSPIEARSEDPAVQALVELFNSMLAKAQTALEGYNAVRETQRRALGDHSCLEDLQDRLVSLSNHCLTGLGEGLAAVAVGDLTVDAHPVTTPVVARSGESVGQRAGDRAGDRRDRQRRRHGGRGRRAPGAPRHLDA